MEQTIERQRQKWATTLQHARRNKGISQETLARLSGLSLSYIQKIENATKGNEDIVKGLLVLIERQRKAS